MTSETERKTAEAIKENAGVVYKLAALGLICSGLWMYTGYHYLPVPVPTLSGPADHLVFTIRWLVPSLLTIVYGIHGVVRRRMKTNMLTSLYPDQYSDDLKIWRSFLESSMEQFALHTGAMLALSTYLEANQMKLIPLFVVLFVVGRVCFIQGYSISTMPYRPYRAFGYNMTQWPTVGVLVYCLYQLIPTLV